MNKENIDIDWFDDEMRARRAMKEAKASGEFVKDVHYVEVDEREMN